LRREGMRKGPFWLAVSFEKFIGRASFVCGGSLQLLRS
jgi:hypothetical protein